MLNEKEQICAQYIDSYLEEPLQEGILKFRTWKSCADIRDIDIYHKVAQALQQRELSQGSGIFYIIRVPKHQGDRFGDSWNVCLVGEQDNDFLAKYGEHYKIVRI